MAVLLSARNLSHRYDSRPLFESLNFAIDEGERVGLIGPNGAGKSSLLKLLASEGLPDEGEVVRSRSLRVGIVHQDPELPEHLSVREALLEAADDAHDRAAHRLADELLWKFGAEIDPHARVESLSGGWKKRVSICRALMRDPNLLLLDEPTNHLDVEGILWLEDLIKEGSFATLTITHDRLFLQRVCRRILELDRQHAGGLLDVRGNYSEYLKVKENLLSAQETRESALRGILRRETEWMRQGAKARTTKQQARIERHGELSDEVSELEYRNRKQEIQFEFQESGNQPKRLIEAKYLTKLLPDGRALFKDFHLFLGPGVRLGILGANGCGKSTLLRVLLGLEKPTSGRLFHSEHLKFAYFEQDRSSLNPNETLMRTLCPAGDQVMFRGKPVHIRSYLERFLFSADRMEMPIKALSGGEKARVLIARLMLTEANLLVLDEPTNDLDLMTLNVLQDCLTEFEGAVLLVSHDRYFVDQVSTKILAFPFLEEEKQKAELLYFEDLSQWESWHQERARSKVTSEKKKDARTEPIKKKSPNADQIIRKIERKEMELAELNEECAKPEVISDFQKLAELGKKISSLQSEIDELYLKI